jgi:hypothetical protein
MPKQENNPTVIAVTQQLAPEYWSWAAIDPNGVAILRQGASAILDQLVQRLETHGCHVTEAYAINHDKDQREVWSEAAKELVIETKPLHIHAVIKFKDRASSAPLESLALWLGIAAEYVEKPGRGGHAYDNMLSYLTHAKYVDKFQYDPSEVATARGRSYQGIDAERRQAWIKGRAHVVSKRAAENFEDLRARVLAGEVSKEEILLTDSLYEIYSRHMRDIDEAFTAFGKRRAMRAAVDLKAGKFETQIVFFTGANGSGKSRTAEWFADQMIARAAVHGYRWEVHEAAARNSMDDYNGEEILMMDEARANAMGAADWLLLMNPEKASPASARYKNKGKVAPRMIAITNTTHPLEYFYYVREKGDIDEAMGQFIRRLSLLVTVIAEDLGTPQERRRYFTQQVQPVPTYTHRLRTRDGLVAFEVDRGFTPETEHTLAGAHAALALDFASRSRDIPFADGGDWPSLETLVATELAAQPALSGIPQPKAVEAFVWPAMPKAVPAYVG